MILRPDDVSLVVIARNEQNSISRCIHSLQALEVMPGEVIFVDNGSTDDTASVIASLAAALPIPHTLVREATPGIPHARNAGVHHASGRIVAFLDADCEAPTTYISALLDGFNSFDVAAVSGRYELRGADANVAAFRDRGWAEMFGWNRQHREVFREPNGFQGLTAGGCSAFRKDALESAGRFDPRFRYCDDIAVSLRLHRSGRGVLLDPTIRVRHNIDTSKRILFLKDLRYGSDSALILKHIEGARFAISLDSYGEMVRDLAQYLRTRDGYFLFDFRTRLIVRIGAFWRGLTVGCLFL